MNILKLSKSKIFKAVQKRNPEERYMISFYINMQYKTIPLYSETDLLLEFLPCRWAFYKKREERRLQQICTGLLAQIQCRGLAPRYNSAIILSPVLDFEAQPPVSIF